MKKFTMTKLAFATALLAGAAAVQGQVPEGNRTDRAAQDMTLPPNEAGMTNRQDRAFEGPARGNQSQSSTVTVQPQAEYIEPRAPSPPNDAAVTRGSGVAKERSAEAGQKQPSAATTEVGVGYTDYSDVTESTSPHSDEIGNNQASESESVRETTYTPSSSAEQRGANQAGQAAQGDGNPTAASSGAGGGSSSVGANVGAPGASTNSASTSGVQRNSGMAVGVSETSAAKAYYETLSFTNTSATLSPEAEQALSRVAGQVDKGTPAALAVRVQNYSGSNSSGGNAVAIAQQRAENVKHYLEQQGVEITDWSVDNLAAQPEAPTDVEPSLREQPQQIVITILSPRSTEELGAVLGR